MARNCILVAVVIVLVVVTGFGMGTGCNFRWYVFSITSHTLASPCDALMAGLRQPLSLTPHSLQPLPEVLFGVAIPVSVFGRLIAVNIRAIYVVAFH